MICQTVSKTQCCSFPIDWATDSYTFIQTTLFVTQIKLPLSNGQEILHIVNILDKVFQVWYSVAYKG